MKTLAIACACFTVFVIWQDLNSTFSASVKLGNMWYGAHPNSLLVSEAIISRYICLLYTSPSPRDRQKSRMPSSA